MKFKKTFPLIEILFKNFSFAHIILMWYKLTTLIKLLLNSRQYIFIAIKTKEDINNNYMIILPGLLLKFHYVVIL